MTVSATAKRVAKHPYRCWCGSRFRTAEVAERHLAAKHDGHGVITFRGKTK